jgi:hypothetical protein
MQAKNFTLNSKNILLSIQPCILFSATLFLIIGLFTPIVTYAINIEDQDNKLESIKIFDKKFKIYVETKLDSLRNYKLIATLEDYDRNLDGDLSQETLLFEAYLDYCVHGSGPKNIPIIDMLSKRDFFLRQKTTDPVFLDYLINTFDNRIPNHINKPSDIRNLLDIWYLDFLISSSSNFTKNLLLAIRNRPEKQLQLIRFEIGFESSLVEEYKFIRITFNGMNNSQGYEHLDYLNDEEDFESILEKLFTTDVSSSLTLSFDELKVILTIINSARIEKESRKRRENSAARRRTSEEYDPEKDALFMNWVKNKIGSKSITPKDLKKFYPYISRKTIENHNQSDFSSKYELQAILSEIHIRFKNEKVRESDSAYQMWLLDKIGMRQIEPADLLILDSQFPPDLLAQYSSNIVVENIGIEALQLELLAMSHRTYEENIKKENTVESITTIKIDPSFNAWLRNKVGNRMLSIPILMEIAGNDKDYVELLTISLNIPGFYNEQEEKAELLKVAKMFYEFQNMQVEESVENEIKILQNYKYLSSVCRTKNGRKVTYINSNQNSAYSYNNQLVINLNFSFLGKVHRITKLWVILHECAHHVLGDTLEENLLPDKETEYRADCWASQELRRAYDEVLTTRIYIDDIDFNNISREEIIGMNNNNKKEKAFFKKHRLSFEKMTEQLFTFIRDKALPSPVHGTGIERVEAIKKCLI